MDDENENCGARGRLRRLLDEICRQSSLSLRRERERGSRCEGNGRSALQSSRERAKGRGSSPVAVLCFVSIPSSLRTLGTHNTSLLLNSSPIQNLSCVFRSRISPVICNCCCTCGPSSTAPRPRLFVVPLRCCFRSRCGVLGGGSSSSIML